MTPTAIDQNAAQDNLLAELRKHIVSGRVQITTAEASFLSLQQRYPHHFPHEGAETVEVATEPNYETDARAFFERIADQVGLQRLARLVVFGDTGLNVAIHLPVSILRKHFASIIRMPKSIFVASEDVSWCISYRMERELVFGRARPQAEADADAENRRAHAFSVPSSPAPPPRLYVILAREAPVGVIFRRGPTRWVQLIRWDTAVDEFTPGQWFHGRIYERRCDLSPDGTKLIYFAQKINRSTLADSEYTYAWTAVSKPPYLTAIALWPKGDCWHGGGLFESNHRVWLNHRPESSVPHPDHIPPSELEVVPNPHAYGEDGPVEGRRRAREGWTIRQQMECHEAGWRTLVTDKPQIAQRPHPSGKKALIETVTAFSRVGFRYEYAVEDGHTGAALKVEAAQWADWDQNGRLVFARDGRIFAAEAEGDGQLLERELANLNDHRPESVPPPEWAKAW